MPLNYVDIALLAVAGIFSLRGPAARLCGRSRGTGGVARRACSGPHVRPSMLGVHGTHAGTGRTCGSVGRPAAGRNGHYRPVGRLVQKILHIACAGWLDHLLGLGIGAIKGAIIASALAYVILWIAPEHEFVKTSQVIPPLFEFVRWVAGSLNLNITLP